MTLKQDTHSTGCPDKRNSFHWILLAAAGMTVGGCSQHEQASNGASIAGVYSLQSVNGKPLPSTIAHDHAQLKILSGIFTINADGTCNSKMTFVPPSGAEATRNTEAVYTLDGSQLKMRWKGAGQTTGEIKGNTFSMNNEGMILLYQK